MLKILTNSSTGNLFVSLRFHIVNQVRWIPKVY